MEPISDNTPIIVIVGQTGSGKSALAMQLAQEFNGEIIAADSRTIYTGMDVGTAKPSVEDQRLVTHHLIDVLQPSEQFTTADFQQRARQAIHDVNARGRLPIVVGGTGLYIDSLLYNFGLRPAADPHQRAALQKLSVEALQAVLTEKGIPLPPNARNLRHLIRSIEAAGSPPPLKEPLRRNTLVIGIAIDKEALRAKIERRAEQMITDGLVEEVRRLTDVYGSDVEALRAPGYIQFRRYLAGELSLDQAKELFVRSHLQYAKRQKTWFKRNPDIVWISKPEESVELVTTFLNNILYP